MEKKSLRWQMLRAVVEVIFIPLLTLCYAGKVCLSVYSWWGEPSALGLELSLPSTFQLYLLPISPPEWTLGLWLLIFAWEGLWVLMAWPLLCKQKAPRIVFTGFYPIFCVVCLLHIGWLYAWARQLPLLALVLAALLSLTLLFSLTIITAYLYYIRGNLKFFYRCRFWSVRVLVLNGTVAYTTFALITTLFNLGVVLVQSAGVLGETASTIVLSLVSSLALTYFLLENTILDRFLRYVFAVYPVLLWALVGVLLENWEGVAKASRNQLFVLVLVCAVGGLLLLRMLLCFFYCCFRPLPDYEKNEPEPLPQ